MEPIRVEYQIRTNKRIFDVVQGIGAARRRLNVSNRTIRPFSAISRRFLVYGLITLALTTLLVALCFLDHDFSPLRRVVPVCSLLLILAIVSMVVFQRQYNEAFQKFLSPNDGGYFTFDEEGICDTPNDGQITRRLWKNYDCCVITDEAIVFLFGTMMLFCDYSEQTEREIDVALATLGKENSILHRKVR